MTKNSFKTLITIFLISMNANAQIKKEKDQNAIKAMCGCYEVSFNFAETFQYSDDPEYIPSATKHAKGLEWVTLLEDTDTKLVLQHLLIVGKPAAPRVIKHWRQDWLFENTELYYYDVDNRWKFVQLPEKRVEGQWTQKVFQVDDSPRYEGSATWIHADGKSYWENITDAPLPRREYTKRNDYNVTVRGNRHEITRTGWIHGQDNKKIIRAAGKEDVLLAEEKGYNTYVKVDESQCRAAQDWWKENQALWKKVRAEWDAVFAKNQDVMLYPEVENKALYEHLFHIKPNAETRTVQQLIAAFVKPGASE